MSDVIPDTASRPATPTRLALAWGVHLFTASGAVLGALALLSIWKGEFSNAALLMMATLAIDSVDGSLARRVGVSTLIPKVDGRRLDDIVDYLNFVIVPAVFMATAGSLPAWGWVALPILASAYGFSQNEAKTEDDFFLGWPSYWNVLALYLWLLDFSPAAGAAWVTLLSLAIFVPLKYVYPSKLERPVLKATLSWGGFVWSWVLVAAILLPDWARTVYLVQISLAYPIYYIALSSWLGKWKTAWS